MTSPASAPPSPAAASRGQAILELLVMLAIAACVRWLFRQHLDDALITYRYARNLAEGNGLVYNPGERVLGTTTPFYAVLLAGLMKLGIAPEASAFGLETLAIASMEWVLVATGRLLGKPKWGWLACAALFHYPVVLCVAGMESALFTACVYGAIFSIATGARSLAAALSAAAAMLRPEGMLLLAITGPWQLVDVQAGRPRFRLAGLGMVAAMGAPVALWLGALTAYYGSPLPNTVAAKQVHSAVLPPQLTFFADQFQFQVRLLGGIRWWGWMELAGLALLLVRWPRMWAVGAWYILYLLFMWAGNAPSYQWYHLPLWPARMLGLGCAAGFLAEWGVRLLREWAGSRTASSPGPRPLARSGPAELALAIAILLATGYGPLSFSWRVLAPWRTRVPRTFEFKNYRDAGLWLSGQARSSGDEVVCEEIGYVGYFSGIRVFDTMGLTSPEALTLFGQRDVWRWALARRSRFVVRPIPLSERATALALIPPEFSARYRVARVFDGDGVYATTIFEEVPE